MAAGGGAGAPPGGAPGPPPGGGGGAAAAGPPRPACLHEVALPPGGAAAAGGALDEARHGTLEAPAWRGPPAKEYPFRLDPFQETAVACLERRESVLVAAHTSAGKTAVAEYAVQMAFRDGERVIYTSPLKALSNQKYRELREEFGDVGLMTGDNSINPGATCVIMTTEILRSMIYRGSDMLREVRWVVFDEVHYMKDKERGVVWEESIIFLGGHTRMVFLSATLQNSLQFAQWVAAVHRRPCHVVHTDQRPVPLEHYAFPQGGSGIHLVADREGFKEAGFERMRKDFGSSQALRRAGGGEGREGGGASDVEMLLRLIQNAELDPAIFFSFSRRDCESHAWHASKKFDFLPDADQKEYVAEVFQSALGSCLEEADMDLPPVRAMLPLLQRGIAVHHSGLLPLLKELVELLFQEQLVKVLFATETFAMGLNMPARTVVFTKLSKWDGTETRLMASGEYIQMSGRAGRRGTDKRGMVIMVANEELTEADCRQMVSGRPQPLESTFKLSYYTLLNTLKRADGVLDQEKVIARSFHQFQHDLQAPEKEVEAARLRAEADALGERGAQDAGEYAGLLAERCVLERSVQAEVLRPANCLEFLCPGRLVRVRDGSTDWGWAVVVACMGKHNSDHDDVDNIAVDVLLSCAADAGGEPVRPLTPRDGDEGPATVAVVPVAARCLLRISSLRVDLLPDLRPRNARLRVMKTLLALKERFGPEGGLPTLDPASDMGIRGAEFERAAKRLKRVAAKLEKHPVARAGDKGLTETLELRAAKLDRVRVLEEELQTSHLHQFKRELKSRSEVLRRLGHIDEEGVVQLKGRAACEIDTADELMVAELMFDGTLDGLKPEEFVALCSCLVPVEATKMDSRLAQGELKGMFEHVRAAAKRLDKLYGECGLGSAKDEGEGEDGSYVESFAATLMDVAFAWSKGAPFSEASALTDMFEGSIIRAVRRLDELLLQIQTAYIAVGNVDLAQKAQEASGTLHRGIMFANSLYIDDTDEPAPAAGADA